MKKDIKIPFVENVYIAIVHDFNEVFKTDDWNVYLINDKEVAIEMILVLSKGYDGEGKLYRETSQMRHKIDVLPKKSGVKIEFMINEVLELNNEFKITFFADNKLYDKTFLIKKNTIKKSALRMVKALGKRGIVIK
ncbi:MAG: hypothetical protein V3U80_07500 [Flavobacteriaceae bacterium]